MKIINIVPGFGGTFYCGNCLRDSAYVASLRKAGHDAMTLPVYLPLTINGLRTPADVPVFYGAVNIYLKQQFPFLQKMPYWMEKLLNSSSILRFAASKAGSTRAEGLEELTESMLMGEHGHQAHELEVLSRFLKEEKPDVIHFSNALLLGMVEQIKRETKARIICSLQDEDVWVDAMRPAYRGKIWSLLAEKGKDVDLFVAVSNYFAGIMQQKMSIPREKLEVVHIGVDPSRYELAPSPETPAIGYVSRICHENGFHILVDAFILLKKNPGYKNLKLMVTGGMTHDDRSFLNDQIKKLKLAKIENEMQIFPDFTFDSLKKFFGKVTLISVPVLHGEAFGLYLLEAMASGVPVVQPALGAFPEIISSSGGGITYQPNDPANLAGAISGLLNDPVQLGRLQTATRKGVEELFNTNKLINDMISTYRR